MQVFEVLKVVTDGFFSIPLGRHISAQPYKSRDHPRASPLDSCSDIGSESGPPSDVILREAVDDETENAVHWCHDFSKASEERQRKQHPEFWDNQHNCFHCRTRKVGIY
jgi:hypothetical protein